MSANTNQASILLTLEILPADAKGARRIIVSGAPAHELPEVRAGLFADRHTLVDDVYRALLKRGPQTIKHATPKADKIKPAAADDEADTDATLEDDATDETAVADNPLETALLAAQSAEPSNETPFSEIAQMAHGKPSAELVNVVSTAVAQTQIALPLIENDPTLIQVEEETHNG